MFCIYILMFCSVISGISTQDEETYKCEIPSKDIIKNGKFKISGYEDDQQPSAGEKLYSYVMEVTCNPGFTRTGLYLVQCVTDKFIDPFPTCVAPCKRATPEIISCGIGNDNAESQCILSQQGESLTTRINKADLQCGVIPIIFRTTVANGSTAKPEDAPWHAGIYTKTTRPYMQVCGGTIVSTNVIISAAHCFWSGTEKKLPTENFAVAVGKIYRPWDDPNDAGVQKSDVKEIRIPPRFQGRTTNFQDDIALLILETPIMLTSLITPACLDFSYDFDELQLTQGRTGRVAGWGLTSADGPASQVLNWAELPVVEIEQCIAQAQPGFVESITSDKICAGFANGTAVCRGDSGGGLLIPETIGDSMRYFLRGIVSTAPPDDHLCNVFAVATFTHIIRHERFIRNTLEAVSPSESTTTTPQSSISIETTTEYDDLKELEKYFTIKYPDDNSDDLETPVANPLTNLNNTKVNTDTSSQIEDESTVETEPGEFQKGGNLQTQEPIVISCEITPAHNTSVCIQNAASNNNNKDNTNSNIGLQVITEAPDSAPITNPPTFTNDDNFDTVNGPNFDNSNNQDDMDFPNQGGSNQKESNQGNKNGGGINQDFLSNGGINKGFINQGASTTQPNLNSGVTNKGGISQSGLNQGGINNDGIFQAGLAQQGNLNERRQGSQLETPNQIGINKGQINQGGISGGINHNLASQLGLNVGGVIQGASNEGNNVQGGLNQGLASQLGLNVGGFNQGDKFQGGLDQGFLNQAGINPGKTKGQINQAQPGINGGKAQGSINGGGINQGGIPQTFTNQGGIIQGGINVGHNTYLPPKHIKNPNINGQITIYPTLTPTVIPINVNPGNKLELKPILTHPDTSTERIDLKTSVLEQYFVTTEPNYQDNYQAQVWQYNSPNYQHNHQNWQWQNWPQKQHDWQNWNSQWEHKHEYPHGYYHHTNKYGGHWWQKYQR